MVDPPYRIKNMMPGMIMLWAGSVASIPSGWTLCDGTMGTPNLTDRFVVGAGGDKLPDATGGSANHAHDFTGDGHYHIQSSAPPHLTGAITHWGLTATDTANAVGTTDPEDGRPPYYALCYIMKL